MKVEIRKPLYGTFCRIDERVINKAIRSKDTLTVKIPQGSATVDPKWWKETGDRVEQVFKYPDRPMVLWGNYVPLEGVPKTITVDKDQERLEL